MSKLLDQVKTTARLDHPSVKTENVDLQHIKRFIFYHGKMRGLILVAGNRVAISKHWQGQGRERFRSCHAG